MPLPNVNYLAYKNALRQAWKDGIITPDESAMLDTLRKSLNISAEEHITLEKEIRIELKDIIPNNNQIPNGNNNPGPDVMPEQGNSPDAISDQVNQGNGGMLETTDIKQLLTAGKNSYHKGNYEEAIDYCDQVLLLDPDNSEALFFRKRTLSKVEKIRGSDKGGAKPKEKMASPEDQPMGELGGPVANGGLADNPGVEPNPGPIPVPETQPVSPMNNGAVGGGDPNCKSCAGSGQCHWCKGSGKCYWCKGTGKCDKCNGAGNINGEPCKSCKGSGKCHSCNGDSSCYWCHGSGKCSKCAN